MLRKRKVKLIKPKPICLTQQENSDNPKDHKYVQPERLQDPGVYSYAYLHQFHPTQQQPKEMDKGNEGYQKLGMGEYMHMYSKPSLLLVDKLSRANNPSANERADKLKSTKS